MDIGIGTKRSIHLDKYIEGNEALKINQSKAYITNSNIPNKPMSSKTNDLMHSTLHGGTVNNMNSHQFSEKVVANGNNVYESTVQNLKVSASQKDKELENKLQSLKNLGSVRNNLMTSQASEMNFSMVNSYSSDRFTPNEAVSSREMPTSENFSKAKASKIGELQTETPNVIIEESQNPDSFFEQPKESSSKNFFD